MAAGRFITIEGGEGAGKSTQTRRLAEALSRAGIEVVATREPGGAPGAEQIRALLLDGPKERWQPMSEALLHFAARHEHVARTIRPALTRGAWVVCDRFADSTRAYQGYGQGVPLDDIEQMYRIAVGNLAPDLTIILDVGSSAGLARTRGRGDDATRYERMDEAFHARVRDGFLDIARRDQSRCVIIDASAPVEAVGTAILGEVSRRLGVTAS